MNSPLIPELEVYARELQLGLQPRYAARLTQIFTRGPARKSVELRSFGSVRIVFVDAPGRGVLGEGFSWHNDFTIIAQPSGCRHCQLPPARHGDGWKCLYGATSYVEGPAVYEHIVEPK
jgi:hypothetical protein